MRRMEQGAMDSARAPKMRKGKVPDNITCCFFSNDQIRRSDRQEAGARRSLEIPA
jgi:hypothetical protein